MRDKTLASQTSIPLIARFSNDHNMLWLPEARPVPPRRSLLRELANAHPVPELTLTPYLTVV